MTLKNLIDRLFMQCDGVVLKMDTQLTTDKVEGGR